jgi:hypothetical protein
MLRSNTGALASKTEYCVDEDDAGYADLFNSPDRFRTRLNVLVHISLPQICTARNIVCGHSSKYSRDAGPLSSDRHAPCFVG